MAFAYSRSVVIDHTKVGATDSSNFPVGIVGTYASLATVSNGGHAQSANGYDIRPYADSAGTTALDYELVSYNATTGAIELWVRVPTLSHSADTTIYLFYGDASISTNGSSATTWDSNFKAVYHFGDGTTLNLNDSTANANTGANGGATATTGQITGGAAFNGTSNYVDVGTSSTLGVGRGGPITVSVWAKFASLSGTGAMVCNGTGGTAYNWAIRQLNSTTFDFFSYDGGYDGIQAAVSPTLGAWNHFVGTWDGSVWKLYYNAVSQSATFSANSRGPLGGTNHTYLGVDGSISSFMNGALDEPRVSNVARSADWITAEYNNQSSPSTFYTLGTETPVGGGSTYTLTVTSGAVAVAANAVRVAVGRRLALTTAAYAVAASSVGLTLGRRIAVATAAVTVVAQPVAWTTQRALAIATRSLVVGAPGVTLSVGRRLAVAPASYSLAGQSVGLRTGRRLALSSTPILITAHAVTLIGPPIAMLVLPTEPVWLAFDPVATTLAFDPVATTLTFLDPSGDAIMGPLQIRQYDLGPVSFVLLDATGNAVDLTNAATIRWTVRRPGKAPIIDHQLLTPATPRTSGRVSYTRQAADVASAGPFDAEVVVYWIDGTDTSFPTLGAAQVIIEPALRDAP